ncbi:DUF6712 family protein [Prevotella communis]|uniref:DUF6712 family protein n=1 Tax=Prevotella communis TaxID=2913614 RepID=UPI003D68C9C3
MESGLKQQTFYIGARHSPVPSVLKQRLFERLINILHLLSDIQVHPQCYYDLVIIIREHPDVFPDWHSSPVAELYTPKVFPNTKKSSAYWL